MATRPKQIVVRNVDPGVWQQFRVDTLEHDVDTGVLLTQVLTDYLKSHRPCPRLDRWAEHNTQMAESIAAWGKQIEENS